MPDTTGNFQDLVQLSGDTLYDQGEALILGNSLASSVTFGLSNSNGLLVLVAEPTGNATVSLPNAGTLLTNVNLSAGTTSQNLSNWVYSNSNGVSFGLSGSTITASIQPGAAAGIAALEAGTQTATSGTAIFSNSNNVSFGMNGSATVTASAQVNLSAGTTSNNLSAWTYSNSNNLSFGLNAGTITASAQVNLSAGTTSGNLSAWTYSNANNVSFGLNAGTITASATVASTQASINLSAGTTSNLASAFTFGNANGVSFGLNASTVTASVATSLTNINVSAGTTSNLLSALTFGNANGVSFGLNASTVTASVATSLTAVNLSAGTTSNNLSAAVFSNSNNVSFGLSASTITASANLTVDYWDNLADGGPVATNAGQGLGALGGITASISSLFVAPLAGFGIPFPADITANTCFFPDLSVSGSTATMSLAFTSVFQLGIYTLNAKSLSLLNSASYSFGFAAAATNNSTAFAGGFRYGTFGSTAWSSSPVFRYGSRYWMAWLWSSAGALNQTLSVAGNYLLSSGQRSGFVGVSSLTATSNGEAPFYGMYTAQTAAMPASIGSNQLQKTAGNAGFVAHLIMANNTAITLF
jgi:hypothetical protein